MKRSITVTLVLFGVLAASVRPASAAPSDTPWERNDSSTWHVGVGGDNYRSGYAPSETRPSFFSTGHLGTGDSDGPWLQWQTKLSDLPSGVFPGAGIAVADGLVYVGGGATNTFYALHADTGLPAWAFQPDNRLDGYTAQYPASNAPIVKNGIIYVTFSNGIMYALNANTGRKIWSYQATDGWAGGPAPPTVANDPERKMGTGPFDQVHPPIAYPKIHGVTAYCDGMVYFMTLAGYAYGLNASTGQLLWHKYVDAPDFPGELTWWEYAVGGALKIENKSSGSSTRRFEAVPGLGCLHGEILIMGSDGHLRWLNPKTGKQNAEYDATDPGTPTTGAVDFCQSAGWNCDAAIGQADPVSGDYLISFLDGKLIRFDWHTHKPVWSRDYSAPLPFQVGSSMPLALDHKEHGFLTEAVAGGPFAEDVPRKVLYVGDQDGYVYGIDISGNLGGGLRPNDPMGPRLLSYWPVSPNTDPQTPYTRRGQGGPWDNNQIALSGLVLGGDTLYAPTWDNRMTAFDVSDPNQQTKRKIWTFKIETDPTFKYPPFGDTFQDKYFKENGGQPFVDLDNKTFSVPALVGGHLYFSANNGTVYNFDLHHYRKTVRNLIVIGSGLVPFLPKDTHAIGTYDHVWTTQDWYKNQVAPAGYRLPASAGVASTTGLAFLGGAAWWWWRRRDDFLPEDTA